MKNKIQFVMLLFVVFTQAQLNKTFVAPLNDEIVGAFDILNGNIISNFPTNGTNIGATISVVPVSICDILRNDTWFIVTIPSSGNLTIETSQADSNSIYDTVMSVYCGTTSGLALVDCNDDLNGVSGFSRVILSGRTAGEKLYVSVWRFGDSTIGDFKVSAYDASVLSTYSNDLSNISITPNPTTAQLNIVNLPLTFDFEIYNVLGQKIQNAFFLQANATIDVSGLVNGTYFLKINTENSITMHRFIKFN